MQLSSISLALTRYSGVGFNPQSLFANGEQGVFYDPSDLTTLFQDSAGTTPVTAVEQAVGLMLDKSKGLVLGSELYSVNNWLFYSSGNSAANVAVVGSQITFTPAAGSPGWVGQQITGLTVGAFYKITYRIVSASTSPYYFRIGTAVGLSENYNVTSPTIATDLTVYVAATANNFTLSFGINAGGAITFTALSVRELPGNHAYQSTGTSRPILRARYNLLTYSEDFSNAAWEEFRLTKAANVTTAPDGTLTADSYTEAAVNGTHVSRQLVSLQAGVSYTASFYAKASTANFVNTGFSSSSNNYVSVEFNLSNGTVNRTSVLGTWTLTSANAASVGNNWYRCVVTFIPGAAATAIWINMSDGVSAFNSDGQISYLGNTGNVIFLWGAQLLTAADVTATGNVYQRIAAATVYDTSNAVWRPYLAFDGTDDGLLTNSVDFATVTSDGQARRNLLLNPTQFDAAGWTLNNLTVTGNAAVAPDGTTTADKLIPSAANATHSLFNAPVVTVSAGVAYTASVYVKAAEYNFAVVVNNTLGAYTASVCINLTTGAQSNAGASGTYTVTDVGNGWWRVTATATATTTNGYLEVWPRATAGAANTAFAGDGTSGVLAWGAQLELGSTATAFQNIGTDKMTVFAGVTKLGSVTAMLTELSANASGNGAFYVTAPLNTADYSFKSTGVVGSAEPTSPASYAAPITNVITGISNMGAPVATLRLNGTQVATSTSSQGTGNYGNYPLYIGRRNNASLPFNGRQYSLIIRGAASTAAEISATEAWVNQRTGAYT